MKTFDQTLKEVSKYTRVIRTEKIRSKGLCEDVSGLIFINDTINETEKTIVLAHEFGHFLRRGLLTKDYTKHRNQIFENQNFFEKVNKANFYKKEIIDYYQDKELIKEVDEKYCYDVLLEEYLATLCGAYFLDFDLDEENLVDFDKKNRAIYIEIFARYSGENRMKLMKEMDVRHEVNIKNWLMSSAPLREKRA